MPRAEDAAPSTLPSRLREAYLNRDLEGLGQLLTEDVRWGDDDHPRRCRGRADVLATFSRGMNEGIEAEITALATGSRGILCELAVNRPSDVEPAAGRSVFHVYLVRDGRIAEIRRYDDRASAAAGAGL